MLCSIEEIPTDEQEYEKVHEDVYVLWYYLHLCGVSLFGGYFGDVVDVVSERHSLDKDVTDPAIMVCAAE